MLQSDGTLVIDTPEWALPLLEPKRYKGAKGGRSSGKSHTMGENLVEQLVMYKDAQWVCIREIQRSLKFSAKKLLEGKIRKLGVEHLFDIRENEIRRVGGHGIIIFQGMQDHTADTIKSLEGFDGAWVEEAQSLSARSLELLIPTIRKPGSEVWFSWNPDQPDDAVDSFFRDLTGKESIENVKCVDGEDFVLIHVNYEDNPWNPPEMLKLANWQKRVDYERYAHIWLGKYNSKSEAQVFNGRWRIDEFEPEHDWDGPYQGGDFGFSQDPTCAVRLWIYLNTLYIEYDDGDVGLDLDDTAKFLKDRIPGFDKHESFWDSARPESISLLNKPEYPDGRKKPDYLPRATAVSKWSGSVEDGVEFIKTFDEIVIHTRCKSMAEEARLYKYKIDSRSGRITAKIEDAHNHRWDAVRYGLSEIIKQGGQFGVLLSKRHRAQ